MASRINLGRVILGGLLAGLVSNLSAITLVGVVLREEMEGFFQALHISPTLYSFAVHLTTRFAIGIALVWLYATMRPRFGPGPKTAVVAGLTAWFFWFAVFVGGMGPWGLFPAKVLLITTVWGLFEAPVATLAGAWLYKEV